MSDVSDVIKIGVAAHICAAAPGGPRYDGDMTIGQRRSAENGIWLCEKCARFVDSKDPKFTVELLKDWKYQRASETFRSVTERAPFETAAKNPTTDELRDRLCAAAKADLGVFRNTTKWPDTTIALTLKVEGVDEALSTRALAEIVTAFDDLILVAAPGMGKTTTVFQVAEGLLETGCGTPLIVMLGEWATDSDDLLQSILKRSTFASVSLTDFYVAAAQPGVVLLLDGWNELDAGARERARIQISRLEAELPEIRFVFTAREQALDIPFSGVPVDLLPLADEQQMAIAHAMCGEGGKSLVDQAWRTAGVRELITIPLYLTALLSLPEGSPFPTTKEELLRRFVDAQEKDPRRAAALLAATDGFHDKYLSNLAIYATDTGNTSISDGNARRAVSTTINMLLDDGQITFAPSQPHALLDTLVSNHVLMRSGDTPGYLFQHQQFQE